MQSPETPKRQRIAALLLCSLLAIGLAGCGDDDEAADDAGASAGETEDTAADQGSDGEADLATYCEKTLEIETAGEPDVDFQTATPEEIAAAAKEFAQEEMVEPAHEIQDVAPEEIAEEIDALVAAVDELAETGDFEAAFGEDVAEAEDRVHDFDLENCEWATVDVSARDYAFTGIEPSYEAGVTSFELANEGKEMHELLLLRKKDDITESFEELLELPQDEAEEKVDTLGQTFAVPGETGAYSVVDLEPGEYMAICFIPTGLTPEVAEAAENGGPQPEGPPHFVQGMKVEFSVE